MFLFPFKNNIEGENQNDSTQRKPHVGYKGEMNISSESMIEFNFLKKKYAKISYNLDKVSEIQRNSKRDDTKFGKIFIFFS